MSAPDRCNKCGKLEDEPVVLNRLCDDCMPRCDETAAEVAREMREESEWKNSGYSEQHAEWASRLEAIAKPETQRDCTDCGSESAFAKVCRERDEALKSAKPETPECEDVIDGQQYTIDRLRRERDEAKADWVNAVRQWEDATSRAETAEAKCERLRNELSEVYESRNSTLGTEPDRPQWTGPEDVQRAKWRGLELHAYKYGDLYEWHLFSGQIHVEVGSDKYMVWAQRCAEGAARDYLEKQEREDALELHTCRDVPRDNSDSGMGHVCVQRQMALTRARDYLEKQDESDSSGIRNVHDGNDCGCSDRIVLSERRLTRARECARIARNAGTREAIGYLCDAIEEIAK
jgi:hypothetical protein